MAGAVAQHLGGTVGTIGAVGTVAILLERGISMVLLAQLRRQTTKATQEQIQQYRHRSKRYVLHNNTQKDVNRCMVHQGGELYKFEVNSGCFLSFDRLCPCWPSGEQAVGRWFYAASIHYMSKGQQF